MPRRIERPALLTRMSTPPCSAISAAINAWHCSGSAISAAWALQRQAAPFRLNQRRVELALIASDDEHMRAGVGEPQRGRLADAGGAAGHQDGLAGDPAAQGAVDVQVGIEMALPVIPETPRVILDGRDFYAALASSGPASRLSKRVG